MQPIERYGVISLLFLIVTIVAVLLWDGDAGLPDDVLAAQELGARTAPAEPGVAPREAGLQSAGSRPAQPPTAADERKPRSRRPRRPGAGGRAQGVEEADAATLRTRPQGAGLTSAVTKERQAQAARQLEEDRLAAARAADEADREERLEAEAARRAARDARLEGTRTPEPLPESRTIPVTQGKPRTAQRPGRSTTQGSTTYTIQPGDVLSKIAQRKLGTFRRMNEIVALNPGLDPDRLVVGREIRLPSGAAQTTASKVASKPGSKATTAGATPFRVRPGDSLWKIAADALGKGERWNEIARLNPGVDPNKLSVGQALVLPTGATVPSTSDRSRPVVASRVKQPSAKSKGKVR